MAGTAKERSRRCAVTRKCCPERTCPTADGSEWYFPERLTIDTGAVAEGNANPAQEVLDEHAIFGHSLPTSLKILAIDTELDKILLAAATRCRPPKSWPSSRASPRKT